MIRRLLIASGSGWRQVSRATGIVPSTSPFEASLVFAVATACMARDCRIWTPEACTSMLVGASGPVLGTTNSDL